MTQSLLPPPHLIGAPDYFSEWRPHQPAAVIKIVETDKRFVSLVLPTGAGKSLTVVGAALLAGWRTAILTSTKALQAQYSKDFADSGMAGDMAPMHWPRFRCSASSTVSRPCSPRSSRMLS